MAHRIQRFPSLGMLLPVGIITFVLAQPAAAEEAFDISLRQALGESAQAIKGEWLKGTLSMKAVKEGLATYRTEVGLQKQLVELKEKSVQPDGLCQTMDSADALARGPAKLRAGAREAQRKSTLLTSNVSAAIDAQYAATNENFCSASEVGNKVCAPSQNPQYANLAGADQDALYLFQSRSGGETYEGTSKSGQVEAVDSYIARVVSGGVPVKTLSIQRGGAAESKPAVRAYTELERRYQAFISMASYSLNSIKGTRLPSR